MMRTIHVLFALTALALHAAALDTTANLLANPGFEDAADNGLPAHWSGPAAVYQRDTENPRTGAASLHYANEDPSRYVLCGQPVSVVAGRIYEIGAWVKTKGIAGEESGATLCMEWYGADGKYIGGCYPTGIKGDNDWTWVHGTTNRVPEDVAHCSVSCYVREKMTGTAWWDDVSVCLTRADPMQATLLHPNYRGEAAGRVVVRAMINLVDFELTPEATSLAWKILQNGGTVDEGVWPKIRNGAVDVGISSGNLPLGDYEVELTLTANATGETLSTKRVPFRRVEAPAKRTAYIDAHNRLILDGAPFFPLGMYWGGVTKDKLDVYADSPFNCLMPYGSPNLEQMDWCQEKGLKVIYSVKDSYFGTPACVGAIQNEADEAAWVQGKAEAFRDHPALLAWYINDELGVEVIPRLAARQRQMETLDPNHPTWVVLYQVGDIAKYLPTFDIIGTDPYPIPSISPARAGEWTRMTVAGVGGARPVWQVPQVFNWGCYKETDAEKQQCRPPTLDEMRVMAWQCICEGAQGIVFYSWFDLFRDPAATFEERWPLVKQVAQEIKEEIPYLLSVELPPCIVKADAFNVSWTLKRLGGTARLFAANPTDESRTIALQFARPPKGATCLDSSETIPVERAGIQIELPPLAVRCVALTLY